MEKTHTSTHTKWSLDPAHSEIGFKVKHLMVTNVRGVFKDYKGSVFSTGEDFLDAEIDLSISSASVSTGDNTRDAHLKSADFFDVENFKEIKFKATELKRENPGEFTLHGDLTIKSVTRSIWLDVGFNGFAKDSWGAKKAGFEITGKISRKDFGLTWNTVIETGGVMVGDEVSIKCEIQLTQQSRL